MKATIRYYLRRWKGNTPKALKRIQWLLGALIAACAAFLFTLKEYGIDFDYVREVVFFMAFAGGGIAFLTFSTDDPKLQ